MEQRYLVVQADDGTHHLLSHNSYKILRATSKGPMTYLSLSKRTQIPISSLYVFVSRLRKSKLVRVLREPQHREVTVQAADYRVIPLKHTG